jgi:DNA-binding NarL/FixJ family response regulator
MGDCGTVVLIDRDSGFRRLAEAVASRIGCGSVGAETGEKALALLGDELPVLAILEVELPGLGGLEVLQELLERFGDGFPVILVSEEHVSAFHRTAGLLVGADDYLVKPVDPGELAARIRRSLRRAGVLANANDEANGAPASELRLTPREREVLGLLAEGRSQAEIADALVISPKTVSTHVQRLLGKLGVHSRTQAVARAFQLGIVEPEVRAHAEAVAAD